MRPRVARPPGPPRPKSPSGGVVSWPDGFSLGRWWARQVARARAGCAGGRGAGGWQIRPGASVSRPECGLVRPARQARRGQSSLQGVLFRGPTASASGGGGRSRSRGCGQDARAGEGRADGKSARERLFLGPNAASGGPPARPAAAKVPFRGRRFVARWLQPRAVAGAAGRAGAGMMCGRALRPRLGRGRMLAIHCP